MAYSTRNILKSNISKYIYASLVTIAMAFPVASFISYWATLHSILQRLFELLRPLSECCAVDSKRGCCGDELRARVSWLRLFWRRLVKI